MVNGHREGLLLLPSLRSAATAMAHAEMRGVRCEMMLVLDRPDGPTVDMANRGLDLFDDPRRLTVDFGDAGASRNAGVEEARGTYVALLDGDDLWSKDWLSASFAMTTTDPRSLVLHPEFNLYFGHAAHVFHH